MLRALVATLFIGFVGASANASPIGAFTDFVGFGDSFGDKGRFPSIALAPPSNDGRFTDGTTWMEQVGAVFESSGGQNYNFALGGATMGSVRSGPGFPPPAGFPENDNDPSYQFIDSQLIRDPNDPDDIPLFNLGTLDRQIDAFFNSGFEQTLGHNPLFVISLGSNDIFQRDNGDITEVDDNIQTIFDFLYAGIDKLRTRDPRFTNFIVTDVPIFDDTLGPVIGQYGVEFGNALSAAGPRITESFDLGAATQAAVLKGLGNGLALGPCIADLTPANPADAFDPTKNQCLVPGSSSGFLFADNVHPNSFVHGEIANAFLTQLDGRIADQLQPIPLPAGLPLLLVSLAGFALIANRKGDV